jgi:FlaA1/EpsC-like NDP-sugar epimerase
MEQTNLHFVNNYYKNFLDCTRDKKLILMGAGNKGKSVLKELDPHVKVAYVVDNDPWKWDSVIEGLDVLPPQALLDEDSDKTVVLIAVHERIFTVEEQLLGLGMKHYYVYKMFFDKRLREFDNTTMILDL